MLRVKYEIMITLPLFIISLALSNTASQPPKNESVTDTVAADITQSTATSYEKGKVGAAKQPTKNDSLQVKKRGTKPRK